VTSSRNMYRQRWLRIKMKTANSGDSMSHVTEISGTSEVVSLA